MAREKGRAWGITERGLPNVGGFIPLGLVNIIRNSDELGVR